MQRVSSNGNSKDQKPRYTFIKMMEGVRNGNPYHGITLEAVVRNAEDLKTAPNGKTVLSFKTPITGRTQYLEKVLGLKLPEKDGTVWAKVSCWDKTAERMNNFFDTVENCSLIVVGSIKASVSQDGKYTNIDITADDWTVLRTWKSNPQSSQGQAQTPAQQQTPVQQQAPVQQAVQQTDPVEMPQSDTEVYYDPAPAEEQFPDGFVPVDTTNLEEDLPF